VSDPATSSDQFAPLRVLFVCLQDFSAPTEKQIVGFATELVRQGHEVCVSFGGDASSVEGQIDAVPGLSFVEHRFVGGRLRRADREQARSFAPTLIHASLSRQPVVSAARQLSAAAGAPVFVHFGDDEWTPPPTIAAEPAYRRLVRLGRRALWPLHPPVWQYSTGASLRWVATDALGLDALTPALAAEVSARLSKPCSLVLPAMPPPATAGEGDLAARFVEAWPRAAAVALFTGSILPEYGGDIMIGLRAVAVAQQRGTDVAFVHAGAVHPRIDWRSLTREAGLRDGTAVSHGYVDFGAIPALLKHADVLLQPGAPSRFNRLRLPAKMESYLASGTPVITFAEGFAELLEDRREVLKTVGDTPQELADRLVEAVEDEQLRAILSSGGPAAAGRLFNAERNTRALVEHYRACLANPPPPSTSSSPRRTKVASS
jgi:glycosyltransferase involved in cell wall biosynthesis